MIALTLVLLARVFSGGVAFTTNTSMLPQQPILHTNNVEGIFQHCQQTSLRDALQQASGTGVCVDMLSSVSHCVWRIRKNMCLVSGPQCENITRDSLAPMRGQAHLPPGVWRNMVELVKKKMFQGEKAASHTFQYRRECMLEGDSRVTVGCHVEKLTKQTSLHVRDAIVLLRPESSSWVAEFSLELSECSRGSVIRGFSILSHEDVKDTNTSQWLQVGLTHSRQATLHLYTITIPGLAGRSVSVTRCRGFKSYIVKMLNVSLWRDTCWRDRPTYPATVPLHLLGVFAAATLVVVGLTLYTLSLTLDAKALIRNVLDSH